jgi:hypothetical protein
MREDDAGLYGRADGKRGQRVLLYSFLLDPIRTIVDSRLGSIVG